MIRAVYIGAGVDIIPVLLFPQIKEFIYIDSQPFSEFGTLTYQEYDKLQNPENDVLKNSNNTLLRFGIDTTQERGIAKYVEKEERFENLFSRPKFLPSLDKIMKQNNFNKIESNDEYIIYKNNEQQIKYYYSLSFPEYLTSNIIDEIKTCNTLILCGYDPNKIILEYLQNPYLIVNSDTCYYNNSTDENYEVSSVKILIENPKIIKKYYLINLKEYEYCETETILQSIISKYNIIEINDLHDI
jgi:hypothetical protein